MTGFSQLVQKLRRDLGSTAVFVIDDLGRIVAFATETGLSADALGALTATVMVGAEEMLQRLGEPGVGVAWDVGAGQSVYATEVAKGLAVLALFSPPLVDTRHVHARMREAGRELARAVDQGESQD